MFSNRYFKLALLTLVISAGFLLIINLVFMALDWSLPFGMQLVLCVLAAGYLVYRFFEQSIQ